MWDGNLAGSGENGFMVAEFVRWSEFQLIAGKEAGPREAG
jgi:hypothetical protein